MNQMLERRQVLRLVGLWSMALPAVALASCETTGRHRPIEYYGGGSPNSDHRGSTDHRGGGGGGRGH